MSRYALVVGVDKYENGRWPRLHCCGYDAIEISEVLSSAPYDYSVTTLLDEDATAPNILRHLIELRQQGPSQLLFYFAGHGANTELGSYLVTYDNADFSEGVELTKLAEVISGKQEHKYDAVVLLDCCHAGGAKLSPAPYDVSVLTDEIVAREFSAMGESRAILAACGANENAKESRTEGHGVFTNYLLQGLRGSAADHEGRVSALSLQLFAAPPMSEMVGQVPVLRGDIHGTLVLAEGLPPRLAPPLPSEQAERLELEGAEHLERYSRLLNSYDPSAWRSEGYERAYRTLTPIYEWFSTNIERNPELLQRKGFAANYEALTSRRQALGTVEPGMRIEEGEIVKSVGAGGYGEVWLTRGAAQDVAFKIYHPHELRDVEKAGRFRDGYNAMRMLKHPRIVEVFRFSECPLGFAMPLIPGDNLRESKVHGFLEAVDLLHILESIAETIQYAHSEGVIHRDIKPENIILTLNAAGVYQPYLTDFDLAWYSTINARNTQSALGVVYYAAPEQHIAFDPKKTKGKRPTLDVFSFGQLVYFTFTGRDPDPVKLSDNAQQLMELGRNWSSGKAAAMLRDFYTACCQWEPEDRIPDFSAILSRLRNILSELTYTTPDRKLKQDEYLAELVFSLTGQYETITGSGSDSSIGFSSRSWIVNLSYKETFVRRKLDTILVAQFIPTERASLPGVSNDRMRQLMNNRVDEATRAYDFATRRNGKKGEFEVFVEFKGSLNNISEMGGVRDAISDVLAAFDRA